MRLADALESNDVLAINKAADLWNVQADLETLKSKLETAEALVTGQAIRARSHVDAAAALKWSLTALDDRFGGVDVVALQTTLEEGVDTRPKGERKGGRRREQGAL